MRALASFVLLCCASACVRSVREERREQPVDTGVRVSLSAQGPRRWDFGDGQFAQGEVVEHAFAKAGRYEVKAFDQEHVTDRISVLVQPRDPFRAVAPNAEAVLVFRSFDDVVPAIDFVERLGTATTVLRAIDRAPVLQFLLEPGAQGVASFDRLEGAGAYLPSNVEALVSFFGVHDEALGQKAFREFLVDHGWRDDGPGRFVSSSLAAELLADRGTVFFVTAETRAAVEQAVAQLRSAPNLGLESDVLAASAIAQLASGGVAVLVRPAAPSRAAGVLKPGQWSMALGALKFTNDEARLVGRIIADRPLWQTPSSSRPARLLAHAPEGPVALVGMDVPLAQVLDAFGLSPKSTADDEVRAGLAILSRRLDLSLYVDVEEFLSATIRGGGMPKIRFTLLGEASAPDRVAVQGVLERLLSRRNVPFDAAAEKGLSVWRTSAEEQPLELALDADTLYARWGRSIADAAAVDLVSDLGKRAEGACGPGHLTAFVDVGQLLRELQKPRRVPGLDARKVVATQALTSTFISQLTNLEQVLLDLSPTPQGASLYLEVKLSKRNLGE